MRLITALLLLAACLLAQSRIRLYLKDGSFQLVREYKLEGDRVKYYSIERSEWEEIPADLIDLKKTQAELKAKEEVEKKAEAESKAEEEFEKEQKREVAMIPSEYGLYQVAGNQLRTFKQAESKLVNDKKKSILKRLSPIPIVAGKSTVELEGEQSKESVDSRRPIFYFRPSDDEQIALVKCTISKKGTRIVETWNIVPVVNEIVAERNEIPIFQQLVKPGVFRVWPVKDLDPGAEYAIIEFTEGKGNTQTWDFRVLPTAKPGE